MSSAASISATDLNQYFASSELSSSSSSSLPRFRLAVHGGAGTIVRDVAPPFPRDDYRQGLKNALVAGYNILANGGTAEAAVLAAVQSLEDCPLFNAGCGAVYNRGGFHELDASVMDGRDLTAGALSIITHVKNPILLANTVRIKCPHVFLIGDGAENFAKNHGKFEFVDNHYYDTEHRHKAWLQTQQMATDAVSIDHSAEAKAVGSHASGISGGTDSTVQHTSSDDKKFGTVGAVALDIHGNLFAGTSTGGLTNKYVNRVGDTSCIGAGTYADNLSAAVSTTGWGEGFIRSCAAKEVCSAMEWGKLGLLDASKLVLEKCEKRVRGFEGGWISVDKKGNVAMPFNSTGMYRGVISETNEPKTWIWKDE